MFSNNCRLSYLQQGVKGEMDRQTERLGSVSSIREDGDDADNAHDPKQ